MTDRIELLGIEVFAHHGVFEHERLHGQRFIVDVIAELDLVAAGRSDRLADTLDYGALAELVHRTVAEERWDLIERVAERVAEIVLDAGPVDTVEVAVHKPEAPMPVPVGDVVVRIRRSRP